jgi:squalene cyclase
MLKYLSRKKKEIIYIYIKKKYHYPFGNAVKTPFYYILKKFIFLNRFNILILKIKKYYFNIFINKKYFKP